MQYKSLINPSFLVIQLDVQENLQNGWEIDPDNLPTHNFMFFEVNLRKPDVRDEVKKVFADVEAPKKAGRPAQKVVQ